MTRSSLTKLPAALLAALALSLLPAPLFAQDAEEDAEKDVAEEAEVDGEDEGDDEDEGPWSDALSADHPGFADSSSTMNERAFQGEFGLDFANSSAAFATSFSALFRYGINDRAEARLELPGLSRAFARGDNDGETSLDTIEAGVKLRVPVNDNFQFAFLPHLVFASGASNSPYSGFGPGMGFIADLSLPANIGINAMVVPRFVGFKSDTPRLGSLPTDTDGSRDYRFEVDAALGLNLQAKDNLGFFLEGWITRDGLRNVTPAANGGVVFHITPDVLLDAYVGVTFPEDEGANPYGGLGFVYRYQ